MPELNFKISTPAELAGAEATAAALEKSIGAAKALDKEFGELEKQLAVARTRINEYKAAQDASANSNQDVLKGTQDLTKGSADLGTTTKQLGDNVKQTAASTGLLTESKKGLAAAGKTLAVLFP